MSQLEYSRLIDSLMCIKNCIRLDIACLVSKLSRFNKNPSNNHWKALIRVLKYLKFTFNYGLYYMRSPPALERYNDANWIPDTRDTKFTSDYIFTIGGAVVS